jgi:protein-disulfide isomerase
MKGFYGVLAGVALVGAAILAWLVLKPKSVSIPANVVVQTADTAGFRGYLLGSPDAPVEITEYADFQCPGCGSFATVQFPDVRQRLIETGRLRWRYRDYPLDDIHPYARLSAHAAACADEQGKYWEMNERIYQGQSEWSPAGNATPIFARYAQEVGLDAAQYDACMESGRFAGRIQASLDEAKQVGARVTPSFLVGGRIFEGLNSDEVARIVDSLAPATASSAPAAPAR